MKIGSYISRSVPRPSSVCQTSDQRVDRFQSSEPEPKFLQLSELRFNKVKPDDFQERRLQAAVNELVRRFPERNEERDKTLLRVLARESLTSEDMKRFRYLVASPDSKCEEYMTHLNGPNQRTKNHPFNGKTFDELCDYLDQSSKLYPKIRELAKPLPQEFKTLYRRTKKKHKEREAADGKFDSQELFARGFPDFISAFYSADDPKSILDFGDAEEKLEINPEAQFIDLWHDKETVEKFEAILKKEGLERKKFVPLYDLVYKAGIDVCLYRTRGKANWFNIYNPACVESVS